MRNASRALALSAYVVPVALFLWLRPEQAHSGHGLQFIGAIASALALAVTLSVVATILRISSIRKDAPEYPRSWISLGLKLVFAAIPAAVVVAIIVSSIIWRSA